MKKKKEMFCSGSVKKKFRDLSDAWRGRFCRNPFYANPVYSAGFMDVLP